MKKHDPSRRKFAKKLAYVAPVVLTLKAQPSFAAAGSGGGSSSEGQVNSFRSRFEQRRERRRSFFSRFF